LVFRRRGRARRHSGIGLAIAIAIIEFPVGWLAARILQCWPGPTVSEGYHDITRFPNARRIPAWCCFDGRALFFANADCSKSGPGCGGAIAYVRALVCRGSGTGNQVDVTSADVLVELHETLHDKGIELGFAELKIRSKTS